MAKRLIHTESSDQRTAKVYWDSECQEYCVRQYSDARRHGGADYFTSDRADAIDTARAMVGVAAAIGSRL